MNVKVTKWQAGAGRVVTILAVLHIVGLAGLLHPYFRPIWLALTPLNLVIAAGLAGLDLFIHTDRSRRPELGLRLLLAAILAWGIECISVATGYPFGTYSYGSVLGLRVLCVPLLIGVLWVLLSIGALQGLAGVGSKWQRLLLAALLLTGLDALMEPAAISLGFWIWPQNKVHGLNAAGWFGTALAVCSVLMPRVQTSKARIAWATFIIQAIFFTILGVACLTFS